MTLQDLTPQQLDRVYRRLYRSLPDGGMFGWDWTTLFLLYPSKAAALLGVYRAIQEKEANQT
jgi:hypothetical protein